MKKKLLFFILFTFSFSTWGQLLPYPYQNSFENAILEQRLPTSTPSYTLPQNTTENTTNTQRKQAVDLKEEKAQKLLQIQKEEKLAKNLKLQQFREKLFGYSIFNEKNIDFTPNLRIATPRSYIIGPDDELIVEVYGYSQHSSKVTVTPDGYVRLDKIGIVRVAGLTIEQAKVKIFNRLSEIYIGLKSYSGYAADTQLEVFLGNVRSIRVNILGEVVSPGTYTLSSLSSVLNALNLSGGPNEIGSLRNVQVIRNNKLVEQIDFYNYLISGIQKDNISLQDNDIIRIGTYQTRVEVAGNVKRPAIYEMLTTEKVDKLIEYAGGFTEKAYRSRIKIIRNTDSFKKVVDVEKKDFLLTPLHNGDSVFVEKALERFENKVTLTGAVFRPGVFSLENNLSLSQLIQNADGLREDAFSKRVSISRLNEDYKTSRLLEFNYRAILEGKVEDPKLQKEDVIFIPSVNELKDDFTISVSGEVRSPKDVLPYKNNMTLEDAIIQAGGLNYSASIARIELIRRRNPESFDINNPNYNQVAQIKLFEINRDLALNEQAKEYKLQPFDEIIVRKTPAYEKQQFVSVEGEVLYPGKYGLEFRNEYLSSIIERAGGISSIAHISGAILRRKLKFTAQEIEIKKSVRKNVDQAIKTETLTDASDTEYQTIGIDFVKSLKDPKGKEDVLLEDGDIITIPKKIETVKVVGEVFLPSNSKYSDDLSFKDYISRAGGFTTRSIRGKSYILYSNGLVDRTKRFLFFNRYPKVKPGSEIIVPKKATSVSASQILSVIQSTLGSLVSVVGLTISIIAITK